jgi:2,3-dimethylmalate lyase
MTPDAQRPIPLHEHVRSGGSVWAPGVYDGFSTMVAERSDAPALYVGGYCVSASRYGLPDAGLLGLNDMVDALRMIMPLATRPVIADADTGFGGLLNVQRTVRLYEAEGVAAIHLEDQEMPKKCGHTQGKRVVSIDDMCAKVTVAVESRRSSDTLIIARTDSVATHGLDEAIQRCLRFREAGADVVFVDAPPTDDDVRRIAAEVPGPKMLNMTPRTEGFHGLSFTYPEAAALGFSIVIYGGMLASPASAAMYRSIDDFHTNDLRAPIAIQRVNAHQLVGFGQVWEDEARWSAQFGANA